MDYLWTLIDQIILYIRFRTRARHRQGRGIHPPFAYEFIREAVFGKDIPGLEGIEELRKGLLGNREILKVADRGAGSRLNQGENRSIRNLVKHTAIAAKKGRLLARIEGYLKFPLVIELGTGTGISCLYLGMSSPKSKVLSCEGSPAIAALARQNIRQLGVSNIEVQNDLFLEWLPRALNQHSGELIVFLDGDHRGERLLQYCSMIMDSGLSKAVIVLDDIHWSWDMNHAWRTLLRRDEISLSIELYNTGIVFLGYDIQKNHFVLNF